MTDMISSIPHVAHHAAHIKPIIQTGVPMITTMISSAVSMLIGGGLGWYAKGRGMTGVQNDLANVKVDIEALKSKLTGAGGAA